MLEVIKYINESFPAGWWIVVAIWLLCFRPVRVTINKKE